MSYDFVKSVEAHGVFVNATPLRSMWIIGTQDSVDRWVCNYCGDELPCDQGVSRIVPQQNDIIEHLKDYHSEDLA